MRNRRTPHDFLAFALDVLQSDGSSALTAAGLCDRMGVTRGSFYHHFTSFDDFVDRLMDYWEERYTTDLVAVVEATEGEDAQRALELHFAQLLPHGAEATFRIWAGVNDRVATGLHRVDEHRLASLADLMVRRGVPYDKAEIYADLSVASLIGLQMLDHPVQLTRLRRVLGEIQAQLEIVRLGLPQDPVVQPR
ncbi:MAG TPA: TetR/AcrR family transcriptional regulator [Acidimicrobiales bacterium]